MEAILPIIVQIVTGVLGGQAVGAVLQQVAMSQLPKSLAARSAASLEAQFLEASLGVLRVPILLRAGHWGAFSVMRLAALAAARSLPRSWAPL